MDVTPEEVQTDADVAVRQFSIALSQTPSTGARPPPQIEVTEVRMDSKQFDIQLNRGEQIANSFGPEVAGIPLPPPVGACCTAGVCSIGTEADCLAGGGTYQGDSTICSPSPC